MILNTVKLFQVKQQCIENNWKNKMLLDFTFEVFMNA